MKKRSEEKFNVLGLSWGVQSFTLAAMSALGELEHLDVLLFVDTFFEKSATYNFMSKWVSWLKEHGLEVVVISPKPGEIHLGRDGSIDIPAFVKGTKKVGQLRRQCSHDWKIAPIYRWLHKNRKGRNVDFWLGISFEEKRRVKESFAGFVKNRYPLIERQMTRDDCKFWLENHNLPIPSRSSCIFCPFQTKAEWKDLRENYPLDWEAAIFIDKKIRNVKPDYELYLTKQLVPLEETNLESKENN